MWAPYRKTNIPIIQTLISPLPIRRRPHSIAHMARTLDLTESRTPPHPRCYRGRQGRLLPPALWTPTTLRPSPTRRRLHQQKKSHRISTSGGAQIHICERRRCASRRRGTSGGGGSGSLPNQPSATTALARLIPPSPPHLWSTPGPSSSVQATRC